MKGEALTDRVALHCGDSRDVLKALPDCSVDSVVTDPPYALVSIVKRFGSEGAAPAQGDVYARASAGFMGKTWDTGETAFAVEFWAEVMRVLKPGGHVIAASGTRTYHRLAVAIEDAGFEIRDMTLWLYGSGFPKSHDVSKGIDRAAGARGTFGEPKSAAHAGWIERGRMRGDEGNEGWQRPSTNDPVAVDERARQYIPATPEAAAWQGWGTALKPACEPWVLARKPLESTVAGNVLKWGVGALNIDACRVRPDGAHTSPRDSMACTCSVPMGDQTGRSAGIRSQALSAPSPAPQSAPSSNDGACASGHQSHEGSQADCRPSPRSGGEPARAAPAGGQASALPRDDAHTSRDRCATCGGIRVDPSKPWSGTIPNIEAGRWPANVIHDGSDEVVGAFPSAPGQLRAVGPQHGEKSSVNVYGDYGPRDLTIPRNDSGSAARFFYSAKADADDRLGSKHPTVKPVDLMQYLVRLVTPKGGLVLDPFAGTGTTGEACIREGMRAILIEREPEYQADIRKRMKLAMAGPDERKRARTKPAPVEALPLFGGAE